MNQVYLGLDTSCYTTSLAAVDATGRLLLDFREPLQVAQGERGLQQSAALFQHVQNFPQLIAKAAANIDFRTVVGVAASTSPRAVTGSYMPVFTVSSGQGLSISQILGVPFVPTSHQEGHLAAGIWSAGGPAPTEFLAIHLSGGTSELLKVQRKSPATGEPLFTTQLLGGSTDLHAGQFVDRVGVKLGLGFPAGPKLEVLAREGQAGKGLIPSAARGYAISFSGPEAQAQRLIEQGVPAADVARAVETCICKTLLKLIRHGVAEHGCKNILLVGGVAANQYIRHEVQVQLARDHVKTYFAEPKYSSDNAVGVAVIAANALSNYKFWPNV
ncbi:MAG: O-sialoglycoprotein endopeptidase [Peptococcaceae bacterium]|nr:O-sialoglycoprotein endopeptidase [Peptococcaceae bacterium]